MLLLFSHKLLHNTMRDAPRHSGRKAGRGISMPIMRPTPKTYMEDQPHTPGSDDYLIDCGIEEADQDERLLDDATVRRAAAQLHGGQFSAMYSLASCGAVDHERLEGELRRDAELFKDDERMQRICQHLGSYIEVNAGRGPVSDWHTLTD